VRHSHSEYDLRSRYSRWEDSGVHATMRVRFSDANYLGCHDALGYVSHEVEIGYDRGSSRTDVLGVKNKTIKDSCKDVLVRRMVIGRVAE
jgi:hypothetical protein